VSKSHTSSQTWGFKCQDKVGWHAFVEYQEKTEVWKNITCRGFVQLNVNKESMIDYNGGGKSFKKLTLILPLPSFKVGWRHMSSEFLTSEEGHSCHPIWLLSKKHILKSIIFWHFTFVSYTNPI
jgi:hypothetical protein